MFPAEAYAPSLGLTAVAGRPIQRSIVAFKKLSEFTQHIFSIAGAPHQPNFGGKPRHGRRMDEETDCERCPR
jgi:hypothetical protein